MEFQATERSCPIKQSGQSWNGATAKIAYIYIGTEIEPRTLCLLGKDSSTRLSPESIRYFIEHMEMQM